MEYGGRLIDAALAIGRNANIPIDPGWARKPETIALALLSRTISNFNAAMTLLHTDIIMEARAIVRCMFENQLWIGALIEKKSKFVDEMLSDEAFNRTALGKVTMELSHRHGADMNSEGAEKLRTVLRQIAKDFQRRKKLSTLAVASQSALELSYVPYLRVSHDALHCSVTALARHLSREGKNGTLRFYLNAHPNSEPGEKRQTILLACSALIGAAIGANQILGGTPAGPHLTNLTDEFISNDWHLV